MHNSQIGCEWVVLKFVMLAFWNLIYCVLLCIWYNFRCGQIWLQRARKVGRMWLKLTFSGMGMSQREDRCRIILLPAVRVVALSCFFNCIFDISFNVLALVQYNFEGRYDLVKFVKLAASKGLYFFLRIGPYACAEWNFGLAFSHIIIVLCFCLDKQLEEITWW